MLKRCVASGGGAVSVSPGHPTADGRRVGDLVAGEEYDGAVIVSAERQSYDGGATFDGRFRSPGCSPYAGWWRSG